MAVGSQPFQRLALPGGLVGLDIIDHFGFENEETAIDPSHLGVGLLVEARYCVVRVHVENAETARGGNCGDGGKLAVAAMERDHLGDVEIGDAVAIGEAERAVEIGTRRV